MTTFEEPMRKTSVRCWQVNIRQAFSSFLAAWHFLTVVPPLVRRPFAAEELGRAVGYFPLVGLFLGVTLALLNGLLGQLFPPALVAALVLVAWVLLTGALHLDGFLDACDGLLGGRTPEDRLRIMRDERIGAFALIGGVLLLLVKFVSLLEIQERGWALVLALPLARWGMALAVVAFPYGRPEGLGRDMKDHASWSQGIQASVAALLSAGLIGSWLGLIAFVLAGLAAWAGARFVLTRLPGLTGDIYGALCELIEVLVLLVVVAFGVIP